jgi:hypothetical protein
MPTTAASPPFWIPRVAKLEPNIHSGVKVPKFTGDDYFKDEPARQNAADAGGA